MKLLTAVNAIIKTECRAMCGSFDMAIMDNDPSCIKVKASGFGTAIFSHDNVPTKLLPPDGWTLYYKCQNCDNKMGHNMGPGLCASCEKESESEFLKWLNGMGRVIQ